jgi:hypothetical protein
MEPTIIFGAINLTKAIAEYFNLIESANKKMDKLLRAELETAIRCLKQAQLSNNESIELLREARMCFNKAISLETDIRLTVAIYGLSMCHHFLGDETNSKECLNTILSQNPINLLREVKGYTIESYKTDSISNPMIQPHMFLGKFVYNKVKGVFDKKYRLKKIIEYINLDPKASFIYFCQKNVSNYLSKPIEWEGKFK